MDKERILKNRFIEIERNLREAGVYRGVNQVEKQKKHFKNELANVINVITKFEEDLVEAGFNKEYIEALNALRIEIISGRGTVQKIDVFLDTHGGKFYKD